MAQQSTIATIFSVYKKPQTYLNTLFLLLLFPLGIISFVVAFALLAFSLTLIAAPALAPFGSFSVASQEITSLPIKMGVSVLLLILGGILLTAGLHAMNGLSWLYKKLLGYFQ